MSLEKNYDYDLCVIGGGSGGVRAARMVAQTGAKVCIAEESRWGGTCVIRGCVPKKLFTYAASFSDVCDLASSYGWTLDNKGFDWSILKNAKDTEVQSLENIYKSLLEQSNVEYFNHRAVIKSKNEVEIDNKIITAKRILIATGGRPNKFLIDGKDYGYVSDDMFELETLPKSIIIYGAGYIGVEFASIMAGLGVETTLAFRGEKILNGFDDSVRNHVQQAFLNKNIHLFPKTKIEDLHLKNDKVSLNKKTYDTLLWAVGRDANTKNLGLENAGVILDDKGGIKVNMYNATNIDSIYAIGDVTNRVALTPVAIHEAMCFYKTIYKNHKIPVDHTYIPTAVFCIPEIGTIGMSEQEALKKNYKLDIYELNFKPMKYSFSKKSEKMLMKLIIDRPSQKILGCHIVGDSAAEMIQCLAVAIKMGATKMDLDHTMALHPSAAEELMTLKKPTRQVG